MATIEPGVWHGLGLFTPSTGPKLAIKKLLLMLAAAQGACTGSTPADQNLVVTTSLISEAGLARSLILDGNLSFG